MEWQPIETAPKTSKARLVYCPVHKNTYEVSWGGDKWVHFGPGAWPLREEPTHWMPLPEPPKEVK